MPESHCRSCETTFTALSNFDAHLASLDEHPHVQCLSPWDVGLEPKERKDGRLVWAKPAPNTTWPQGGSESAADPAGRE